MKVVVMSGCFWGAQYALRNIPGISSRVGYSSRESRGGPPTYYNLDVTGYAEAVEVEVPDEMTLELVLRASGEHSRSDPSPATNPRYRRAIGCHKADFPLVSELVARLEIGMDVSVGFDFHPAETYHQDRYVCLYGR